MLSQLCVIHFHHPANVPGVGLYVHGLPDHQRSGPGEGDAAEGGSPSGGCEKWSDLVFLVHREHSIANSAMRTD